MKRTYDLGNDRILEVRKEESGDDGGGEYFVTIKEPSRDRVEALFPCRRWTCFLQIVRDNRSADQEDQVVVE